MARQRCPRRASRAGPALQFLQPSALYVEYYAGRYDCQWIFTQRADVRGRGVRCADHHRSVARPGGLFPAGRDPGRSLHERGVGLPVLPGGERVDRNRRPRAAQSVGLPHCRSPGTGARRLSPGVPAAIVASSQGAVGGMTSQIASLAPWFHNLHLPDGAQTAPEHPLGDFPAVKWRQIAPFVPSDLAGWRVLDIGCNAGFYSFELARRGALVTAIDIDLHYLRQARWAAREYGLEERIEFRQRSVYELAAAREQFDLVWFLGVLYHLRHPLLALDILREVTRRQMVLQALTMPGE